VRSRVSGLGFRVSGRALLSLAFLLALVACGPKPEAPTPPARQPVTQSATPTTTPATPRAPTPPVPSLPDDLTPGGPYTGRITCLAVDQNDNLFAGGWHMGVYRLLNDGQWEAIDKGLPDPPDVLVLAWDSGLLAGTLRGKLVQWDRKPWRTVHDFTEGGGSGRAAAVRAILPDHARWWIGTGSGVWLSNDRGATFERIWNGRDVSALARVASGALLVGTMGSGLAMTLPAPLQHRFVPVTTYPGAKTIAGLAETTIPAPGVLVAAEGDGVYFTPDGVRFERVDLGVPNPSPTAVFADRERIAVALDGVGLLVKPRGSPRRTTIPFRSRITAITNYRDRLVFGTDGLGVLVVDGPHARPLGKGLLNFPDAVVRDALARVPRSTGSPLTVVPGLNGQDRHGQR
jgi:hypothetical protein